MTNFQKVLSEIMNDETKVKPYSLNGLPYLSVVFHCFIDLPFKSALTVIEYRSKQQFVRR